MNEKEEIKSIITNTPDNNVSINDQNSIKKEITEDNNEALNDKIPNTIGKIDNIKPNE